jgi:hypothetical protein
VSIIRVTTQAELDAAIKDARATDTIACIGGGEFDIYGSAQVTAYDSAQVRAYGSAQVTASDSAQVTAYGSAQVRASDSAQVTAYDSAQVRAYDSAQVRAYGSAQVRASDSAQVTAYDSAQVRAYDSAQVRAYGSAQVTASDSAQVTAYDSAQVRAYGSAQVRASDSAQVTAYDSAQVRAYDSAQVRAYGSAQVTASDSAQVRASRYVAVTRHAGRWGTPVVEGGVLIDIPRPRTADEWCEVHGVEVTDGVATLYKAVDDDYGTSYSRAAGILYAPGTTPEAPDWDGGVAECGGGLHFVARPWEGLGFNGDATRFVACPVALVDIAVHEDASMPNKIKARRVCGPIVEVDQDGKAVTA